MIAQREGLALKRSGERYWARCPWHEDKNPSLYFFKDGNYKCFSCGVGGDSVSLLARLRGIPALEAARLITGDSSANYTPKAPEERKKDNYLEYCHLKHVTNTVMEGRIKAIGADLETIYDPVFSIALRAYWWAEECLENIDAQTEDERLERWWKRNGCN